MLGSSSVPLPALFGAHSPCGRPPGLSAHAEEPASHGTTSSRGHEPQGGTSGGAGTSHSSTVAWKEAKPVFGARESQVATQPYWFASSPEAHHTTAPRPNRG